MIPPGTKVDIMGQPCRLVDGAVATGPSFLLGRPVDQFVSGPQVPTNPPHTKLPYYFAPDTPHPSSPNDLMADEQSGGFHVITDPATGAVFRFLDPEAAALWQMYKDQGGSRYGWDEPGDGSVYVNRVDEPTFSASPSSRRVLAKAPANKHNRHYAERHLKTCLKGELYDHLTRGFFPVRVAPLPLPGSAPIVTPTGTTGVTPSGAQGGSGGGTPTGGGSIPVSL